MPNKKSTHNSTQNLTQDLTQNLTEKPKNRVNSLTTPSSSKPQAESKRESEENPHKNPALSAALKRLNELNPDQFEVYLERTSALEIDSRNQDLDALSREEDVGLAIRLIHDRKLGFSFTTSLEKERILEAVNTAWEVASVMPEDHDQALFSFQASLYPNIDNFDSQGLEIPLAEKIELAKKLESHCRSIDPRIVGVRSASISESCREIHLVDSSGEHIQHFTTSFAASITCKAESAGDSQVGSDFAFSNYLDNLDVLGVAERAAKRGLELLGAGAAPTMKCPAVLRNSVVADLVDFLSSSFSAGEIAKGRSMVAGKMGENLFSEAITLVDDGLLPGGYGTRPFDAEGIPCKKTVLIKKGFVAGVLYDCYYAKKAGLQPTGSSIRSIKSPPTIGFGNLFLESGRKTPQALMDGISKGVLITDLMGVHTANPVTGDFSLGASGILIENGKLTRPVRGFAVAGNVLDLFRGITDLGNDLRFFGRVGAPSARLDAISVGGGT